MFVLKGVFVRFHGNWWEGIMEVDKRMAPTPPISN